MTFICSVCNNNFANKSNLKRHIFALHYNIGKENGVKNKKLTSRILCCICGSNSHNYSTYHNHLKSVHNVTLTFESLLFPNVEEFQKWKINFEKESTSKFVQNTSSRKLKNCFVKFQYNCHRSHVGKKHKRKTANKKKSAGSNKTRASCPALIKAIVRNDSFVEVQLCSTHLGHECDIRRIPLSTEERNFLAGQLSAGVAPRRILEDIRQEILPTKLDRIHYTEMKDLYNIKRAYRISCPLRYDNNDRISVESWIEEKRKSPPIDNPVLLYKDQNSELENFEKSDFVLILMTEFQKEMMIKFGKKAICVDGTHGLNDYNFLLFTLLVLDEYDEGIPIAFCFSNKSTKELYKLFFTEVRNAINKPIKTNVFMSDGEMTFYEAWKEIMLEADHQLICHWHLNKIWVTNLSKIKMAEKRNMVLQTLNSLMMEKDVNVFEASFAQFLIRLRDDADTAGFYEYFNKNYVDNVTIWAQCHRNNVIIHTNMGLEALHKNIKYNYLNGARCIRLDKTIYALMCLARDKQFERCIKLEKQKPSKKLPQIKLSHEKSIECKGNIEELGLEKWNVVSSTDPSVKYLVNLVKYEPCCVHICRICQICLHMLTCSCTDYAVRQNICKHIHAVMSLQQRDQNEVSAQQFQDTIFGPIMEYNNSFIGQEIDQGSTNDQLEQSNIETKRLLAKISAITGAIENSTLTSEQRADISKHIDTISTKLSKSMSSSPKLRIAINKKIIK